MVNASSISLSFNYSCYSIGIIVVINVNIYSVVFYILLSISPPKSRIKNIIDLTIIISDFILGIELSNMVRNLFCLLYHFRPNLQALSRFLPPFPRSFSRGGNQSVGYPCQGCVRRFGSHHLAVNTCDRAFTAGSVSCSADTQKNSLSMHRS